MDFRGLCVRWAKQQHPNFDELVKLYEKDVVKHATSYSNQLVKLN